MYNYIHSSLFPYPEVIFDKPALKMIFDFSFSVKYLRSPTIANIRFTFELNGS